MESDQAKIFVGGISREMNEESLNQHFSVYGNVLGSVVAKDRITNLPRGFAFVSFSEIASAERALGASHTILGRRVEVKRAIPRREQQHRQHQHQHQQLEQNHRQQQGSGLNGLVNNSMFRTKKIFVGGLPGTLTEDAFRIFFENFGKINDVVVMRDSLNQPRGFGFVTFDTEESVENVTKNNFYELDNRLVEVKRAIPKERCNGSIVNCNTRPGVVGGSPSNGSQCGTSQNYVSPLNSIGYGISPFYAPPPSYNNVGMPMHGANGYCFSYPIAEYNRICYGFSPFPCRGPFYNPMMCPMPFDNRSLYYTYLPGGYMVNVPGMEGKLIQGPVGNGPRGYVLPQLRALTLGADSSPKIRISSNGVGHTSSESNGVGHASSESNGVGHSSSENNGGGDIPIEVTGTSDTPNESNGGSDINRKGGDADDGGDADGGGDITVKSNGGGEIGYIAF